MTLPLDSYIQKDFVFVLISSEITFCNFWDAFVSSRIVPPIGFELSSVPFLEFGLGSVRVPRVSGFQVPDNISIGGVLNWIINLSQCTLH